VPNLGPFCCNGVVDPFRAVSAKLVEVGHVHRNLVVTRGKDDGFELWNRFGFTFADAFDGHWELLSDGVCVAAGKLAVPHLAPLSRGALEVAELKAFAFDPSKEYFVNFSFKLKTDLPWAEKGWIVARDQVPLRVKTQGLGKFEGTGLHVAEDRGMLEVTAGGTKAVFCRRSGTLCELVMNGKTILRDPAPGVIAGPRLGFARAFTDNDRWLRDGNPSPLTPVPEVRLNLDVRQLGLGGASCGPKPMAKYIFPVERTQWTLRLSPVSRDCKLN